jgi:hypothetical protein
MRNVKPELVGIQVTKHKLWQTKNYQCGIHKYGTNSLRKFHEHQLNKEHFRSGGENCSHCGAPIEFVKLLVTKKQPKKKCKKCGRFTKLSSPFGWYNPDIPDGYWDKINPDQLKGTITVTLDSGKIYTVETRPRKKKTIKEKIKAKIRRKSS